METSKKIEKVKKSFEKRGKTSYKVAKREILKEKIEYAPIYDALKYFIEEFWHNFHHPALLSLTCEAVKGKTENTTWIGASLVLLTGAADIHDDIIDKSAMKESKSTVFGKFGLESALLVGDALLLKGFKLLHDACNDFTKEQKNIIIEWVKDAFFELGTAVAKEASFKGRWDLTPEEYLDVITMKAAVAEVTARLGAFIGGGSQKEVEALGQYGRMLGILATIRDDFIDIFEPNELENRIKNECLPLPILYVLRDKKMKDRVINILKRDKLTEKDTLMIVKNIRESQAFRAFNEKLKYFWENGHKQLQVIKNQKVAKKLSEILDSMTEDIIHF
jgi:geranylgeranyl pyrophosphate synthase